MLKVLFTLLITTSLVNAQIIDVQGHRGARGKMPENTIPAFIYAMDQGVTTLELDVVISKDKKVVVSHEPWLSDEICLDSTGSEIKHEPQKYNIYSLHYAEIEKFDCGSKQNKRFTEQVNLTTPKPLLEDVIKAVERHQKGVTHYEVAYNIEIKSTKEGDGIFHPTVDEFSDLVYELIDQYLPWERVIIQSFDLRTLKYWHEKYPNVQLALLIENIKSPKSNIKELGFTPKIYSPYFKLLTKNSVSELHKMGMQIIPWTVNEKEDMKKMVSWGVNGIITDYPNRARELNLIQSKP